MLVGQSTLECALIKTIIYLFSYLGLICLLYFYLALSVGGVRAISHPVSILIECVGVIEILWYLLWFLPYKHRLQKQPAVFPPQLSRDHRRELFQRSLLITTDIELFARKWMCGAHMDDIRRENIKEWLLWALFNREGPPGDDNEELEEYMDEIEEKMGWEIKPGKGPAQSVRLNFDRIKVTHRSLLYYAFLGTTDFITSMILMISGFRFYSQPRSAFFKSFPFRFMTLLYTYKSASPDLSYFYRPHKSSKHRPIVFIHGVGIGLAPYIPALLKIPKDIGILAIEIMQVSSRITTPLPLAIDLIREIGDIVSQQNLDNFVFIGDSYGTFFTSLFLQSPFLASKTHSVMMIDPVSVLLHLPDVAFNFTRRKPVEPNELELYWAVQTEPGIAFTLGRRFCWRDHVVWREDLLSRSTTIIMGGDDCIVNAEAIASYITNGSLEWTWEDRESWKKSLREWKGEGLELVWLEGYDHGQGIMSPRMLPKIVGMIERYCEITNERRNSFEPDSKFGEGMSNREGLDI
ncbi:hypothetical protein K469DRAFT_578182 [Zopfia rhizophila CBS 207.26]|uniref:Alpha/beta-hydrolase n=1 Tax=Zopfia rhizophila CBS 207.26 TaxID=1314779 RepID=A0A6A6DYW5_9PEZI|nr:hypothetical protein K469DRAFT_578182 [Zopfia rhizophila CBS 207.26]